MSTTTTTTAPFNPTHECHHCWAYGDRSTGEIRAAPNTRLCPDDNNGTSTHLWRPIGQGGGGAGVPTLTSIPTADRNDIADRAASKTARLVGKKEEEKIGVREHLLLYVSFPFAWLFLKDENYQKTNQTQYCSSYTQHYKQQSHFWSDSYYGHKTNNESEKEYLLGSVGGDNGTQEKGKKYN